MFPTKNIIDWICRLVAAGIMLQTLFFKFSAASESVYIFTTLGVEPWGRIASGVFELIASILLLYPRTTGPGAILALLIMGGAILSHLFILGISVQGDGGQLFIYALLVFIASSILIYRRRRYLLGGLPAHLLPWK